MSIKIVKLTPANVEALNLMSPEVTGLMEVTKTTATFIGVTAGEALRMVQKMQDLAADTYGKTGGPYAPLNAVRRKVAVLAEVERLDEDRMRAESAKVEAMRDSGALAEGLAAAKARSDDRAEADAANDPLVTLLGTDPTTGMTYGAAIRPKAWVTAHVDSEPLSPVGARVHAALTDAEITRALGAVTRQATAGTLAMQRYRMSAWSSGRVAGRLLAASKSGQRRPKRSRRG